MATIVGGSGPDPLDGNAEGDLIRGLGGDDTLGGGQGDDSIEGGDGNDRLVDGLSFSADTASDVDLLYGGDGNDTLISNQGNHFQDRDTLYGGAGDDFLVLNGTQTDDSLVGGAGIDTADIRLTTTFQTVVAIFNSAGFIVQLNGINTVFLSGIERIFLNSGTGNDSLVGGALSDSFSSTGGSDTIDGGGGDDVIDIDLYSGSSSALNLNGGAGDDILGWTAGRFETAGLLFNMTTGIFRRDGVSYGNIRNFEKLLMSGGDGADTLTGAALDDIFNARGGNDVLRGEGGDDLIRGDAGLDTIFGGDGNDRLEGEVYTVFGSNVHSSNVLFGGLGNDTLSGGVNVDTLNGGDGDDLYSVDGADVILDSSGVDEIQTERATLDMRLYASIEDAYMVNGGTVTGNDRGNVILTSTTNIFTRLNATGGLGRDTIVGGPGFDSLSGDEGNDDLSGGANNDQLFGGDGNDTASGDAGFDNIQGGAGADLLVGGDGGDSLFGGDDNDVLRGESLPVDPGVGLGSGSVTKAAGVGTQTAPLDLTGDFSLSANGDIINPTVAPHVTVSATINPFGDYYQITLAQAGVPLTIDVDRGTLSGVLDTQIDIIDPNGFTVGKNEGASTLLGAGGSTSTGDAYLTITALVAGTYTIVITDNTLFGLTSDQYVVHFSLGEEGGNDFLDGGAGNDTLLGGFLNDTLLGGAGDDSLNGGSGIDTASYAGATLAVTVSLAVAGGQNTGGAGIDTLSGIENLVGTDFNDRLTGNAGDNALEGGLGNDTIDGGGGIDSISFAAAGSAITVSLAVASAQDTGGAGTDRLIGIENVTGSAFDDVLTGTAGANTIQGGAGNDVIDGGDGDDSLIGFSGLDTLTYARAGAGVAVSLAVLTAQDTGGAGIDIIGGFETLIGSGFADTLSGDGLNNLLSGDAGADLIDGGLGNDSIEGGLGNDTLQGGDGRDLLRFLGAADIRVNLNAGTSFGAGGDSIGGFEDVSTDAGADNVAGDTNGNLLTTGAGNDTVSASGGDDTVTGGEGNDSLNGGGGTDLLSYADTAAGVRVNLSLTVAQNTLGAGTDILAGFEAVAGSAFDDTLTGGTGSDSLGGGAGNDSLVGGTGDDTLQGGLGDDTLQGGGDGDTASYVGLSTGVTVDLSLASAQNTGGGGTDQLSGIENLIGTVFNDVLTGNTGANVLNGGFGSDRILGGDGDDTILGGTAGSPDTLDGGLGNDMLSFADTAAGGILFDLAILGVQSTGAAGFDSVTGFENVTGGGGSDNLKGDSLGNLLSGGLGDDTLEGRLGDDTLDGGDGLDTASYASATAGVSVDLSLAGAQATGGAGSDTLLRIENLAGSAQGDTLLGSGADNSLDGGLGDDSLDGRAGEDSLTNSAGNDTLIGGAGTDTLVFAVSGTVTVDLSLTTAQNTGTAGTDTLLSIENVLVSTFATASLTGNGADNVLTTVTSANDTLLGGGGDDTLNANLGTNLLNGGTGLDTVDYGFVTFSSVNGVLVGAVVDLTLTGVQAVAFLVNDTLTDIEGLVGSAWADTFTGNGAANRLTGLAGIDSMDGGGGNDTLSGGLGADTLRGGNGADLFVFDTAPDLAGFDVIEDMTAGADEIGLAGTIFAAIGTSVSASELRIGAAATTATHRLVYDAATGALSYDADGNGAAAAVQIALLDTGLILTAGDFVVL